MTRALRGLVYVVALFVSAALAWVGFQRLLPWLPDGRLGLLCYFVVAAFAVVLVAKIESATGWKHWLQPRQDPFAATRRWRSHLLTGHAPLPLSLGVAVGALLALSA